jgi:membrane-associated phospholipid phosphatase
MPRRAQLAVLGAALGVILLVLTWYGAFRVAVVARADASVLGGFAGLQGRFVNRLADELANLADPKPFVVLAAVIVLVALIRRRGRVAVAAGAIMLGANVTTQILKAVLHDQHPVAFRIAGKLQVVGSSWPSGHATAAMSLALCAVLVARARWRPMLAAAGAAFAVAVSFSFLTLVWHYPSDVLGGFLVAATWTLMGVAAVWTADARWPRRAARQSSSPVRLTARQALGPPVAVALGAVALVGLVALARPHAVIAYAHAHKAFVVGAAALGALGLALATGLMLATTMRADSARAEAPVSDNAPVPTAAPRRG